MEKKLKFKDIEPPKEQSTIKETELLESLNNFLDGKIEYEKLKEDLKEAENEEDYKKLLKELEEKKRNLNRILFKTSRIRNLSKIHIK